jgi:hypothetical protein
MFSLPYRRKIGAVSIKIAGSLRTTLPPLNEADLLSV